MFKSFILGVADAQSSNSQITQQDFKNLEKAMSERTKDLQDIANSIQSDQISFLQDNISNITTWTSIIVAVFLAIATAIGTGFLRYMQKKSKEADDKMNTAAAKMQEAHDLHEKANTKIEYLEKKQQELIELLDSKALNDKLTDLEKAALLTARLEKQAQATINIQTAKSLLEEVEKDSKKYRQFVGLSPYIQDELDDLDSKYEKLAFFLSKALLDTNGSSQHPHLFNEDQVLGETKNILSQAFKLKRDADQVYELQIEPIIDRRKEKGE